MDKIKGKVWVFGDNVDTDQIIPAERLVAANLDHLNDYIFEKVRPGFAQQVQKGQREIVGKITAADLADYRELQQDPQLRDLLNSVYDVYGHVSAIDLMNQTHRERPWKETPQSGVISDEAIRSYYQGRFVLDEN